MAFNKTLKVMLMGLGLTVGASAPTLAQSVSASPINVAFNALLNAIVSSCLLLLSLPKCRPVGPSPRCVD